MRVAARDSKTGRVGSAMDWVEIPGVRGGPFAISPLIVDRDPNREQGAAGTTTPPRPAGDNRVGPASRLSFFAYVYNATYSPKATPDVVVRTEVFRDGVRVVATPLVRLKTIGTSDLSRIPYFAALNLEGMSSGRYVLRVTATDRTTANSVSQRVDFEIE